MLTVYIDDSGTANTQSIAIASAVIIPAKRIKSLDQEWATFKAKEGFTQFHTSECIARNHKSEFANWNDAKVERVITRVRQIIKKHGVKAFSFAVNKVDYDDVVPAEIKDVHGYHHYTWAIRHVISQIEWWAEKRITLPLEYVFDWMDGKSQREAKSEVETVMEQAESLNPGRFTKYSFRKRQCIPALQCTDMLAWTCYQFALNAFTGSPLKPIAAQSFKDFGGDAHGNDWLTAVTITREDLAEWGQKELNNPLGIRRRKEWLESHA